MEKDAILYKKVRDMLQSKKSEAQILKSLTTKGHSKEEIMYMIEEYKKDEQTSVDDKLVEQIEHMFDEGKSMDEIYSELSKSNHPFEVKKAMLRANLIKFDYKTFFIKYMNSFSLFIIFVLELVITFFINPFFGFMVLLLIVTSCLYYVYSTRHGRKINSSEVSKELDKLNVDFSYIGGIHITKGAWGWNPRVGVYPKFWLFNLGTVFLVIHLIFALFMIPFGFDSVFAAVLMGIFSFASLFLTYRRIN